MYPKGKLVVAGDFNDFQTSFLRENFSLVNRVKDATRKEAILDLIWIDEDLGEFYSNSADVGICLKNSDHNCFTLYPLWFSSSENYRQAVVWDYRDSHLNEYLNRLACIDFSAIANETSVDKMCIEFYKLLSWCVSAIPREIVSFPLMTSRG